MNISTAIIFASGFGSRMLPVTAGVQKELLPILNRPVIDYVVEDCVKAGISRIIFVIRPGSRTLQDYYVGQPSLQHHLERFNKSEALELLRKIHDQATFEFVEQPEDAGYGTAIPVKVARPHLDKNEAVMVCGGDDFLYHADSTSEIAAMIQTFRSSKAVGLLSGLERPDDQLHRYGVIKERHDQDQAYLEDFVEKPAPGTAPSNLINISKYILSPTALDYVDQVQRDPKSGEYYITDAVLACAKDHPVAVHRVGGQFLDAGNMTGWLEANMILAKANPDLHKTMLQIQNTLLERK